MTRGTKIGLAAVALVAVAFALRGKPPAPAAAPTPVGKEAATIPPVDSGGSLLGEAKSAAAAPTTKPVAPVARSVDASLEALLKHLGTLTLDLKTESALRGAGTGRAAKDLGLYLRLKRMKASFSPEEVRQLEGYLNDSLVQNAEEVIPALGRALTGLEGDPEVRENRNDLLALVAAFPPAENAEISRSALSSLGEIYGVDSSVKADDRFDLAVASMQAYLVTTGAGAPAATAAIARAMGGKIDPAVKDPLRSMISDRYPAR